MERMVRHKGLLSCAYFLAAALAQIAAWAGTAGTETYSYDARGRLVRIDSPDGTRASYDYDAAGNRLSVNSGVDATAPSVPTGLTATAVSTSQINLSWTASTDTGGSGLKGYMITRNGSALVTTTSTATTYSDTGLAAATTYTYTVAAYDVAGNTSGASAGVSATTQGTAAGTFQFVSGTHSNLGSTNDIATATIKNSGSATITNIQRTCSGGSFHTYGTPPTSLVAGATGTFQCQAAASGSNSATITLTGTGASNSPVSYSW